MRTLKQELTCALDHLVKAREKLDQEPPSRDAYTIGWNTLRAANLVRHSLKLLDELKTQRAS